MQNLSTNEPEKSEKQLSPLTSKPADRADKPGLTRNILNKVGQGGAVAGSVAGTTFQTLANAVGSTGQIAGLVLAGKLNRGEVPNYGFDELAGLFADWLEGQKRGEVRRSTVTVEGAEIYLVTLKESGFLSGDYLFAFAGTNSTALGSYLKAQKAGAKDFSGVALVLQEWDMRRFSLEKDWSYFVWCGGVRMGKGGAAPDYLSAWLVDLAGRQFEKRELIENAPQRRAPARPDATFTGRSEVLDIISRSVLSTDLAGQGLPWLFSISSVGGAGKSYLLNLVQQTYAPRLLSVRLDHLDYAEANNDLLNLLGLLAARFRQAGCPTPTFDKLYRQITQSTEEAEKKRKKVDFARQMGQMVSGATARKIALQLSKTFNKFWFVKHVPGIIGVGASVIEIGLGLFGQLTQEQQAEIDTLLGSQPVQDLTQALINDISKFVSQQQEDYYLWRRPLLVFDTYEQAGPVVDQWLRTVLLANPAFRILEPVVLVAGFSYFSQTGHTLANSFKTYWETHGGLSLFGYPITEEFQEKSTNGQVYTTQWFERARFEYHPENKGTPYDVLLGLLGNQIVGGFAYPDPQPNTVPTKITVPSQYRTLPFQQDRYINLPPGFKISVFAAGLTDSRLMALAPTGDIFVTERFNGGGGVGTVKILRDLNKDGIADEIRVYASGLSPYPHGIAFNGGYLYVAMETKVIRYPYVSGDLTPRGPAQTIISNLPQGHSGVADGHNTRTIVFGPDGKLYVSIGSSCDNCIETDPLRASVWQYNPDGTGGRPYATGLRNAVALGFDPQTNLLWAGVNGRNGLGDTFPPEQLTPLRDGGNYGWPYCVGTFPPKPDPQFGAGKDDFCANKVDRALLTLQAHTAPLGLTFYNGTMFPEVYRGGLFVVSHGSATSETPHVFGDGIRFVSTRPGKLQKGVTDFATGWINADKTGYWGRTVFPLVGQDGALYVSDDTAGAVYRISYSG